MDGLLELKPLSSRTLELLIKVHDGEVSGCDEHMLNSNYDELT